MEDLEANMNSYHFDETLPASTLRQTAKFYSTLIFNCRAQVPQI